MAEVSRRDFFVSHAGVDQQWAEWISQVLVGAGYSVELDVWEWAPGDDFVAAMQDALARADRVVAVYTDAYFSRPFTQAEHRGAFATAGGPGRILPVRVADCEVPELYAGLIRIELAGLNEAEATARLLDGVAGATGPPARPVAFPRRTAPASQPADGAHGAAAEFPLRLPPVWNIPRRNPFFTGRVDLLDRIHRQLRRLPADGSDHIGLVPLQGMGGIGKSQLAFEYAHRHAREYQLVWWVNADSRTMGETCLVELADALALPVRGPQDAVIRRLWTALSQRADWLLIYDNVDDPAAFADLQPPDSGRILVTSRNPAIARLAPSVIDVAEFDRSESIHLLRRHCPTLAPENADQVAVAVGDLPLAVAQAGCFLAETGLAVTDYLPLLATQPAAAGLDDPTVDRHPGLAAVVAAGAARLAESCPPAADLLSQMAFLAPEPLPLTAASGDGPLGRAGVRLGGPAATAAAVRHLTRLGLVRRAGTTLQAHRLVQALIRAGLTDSQQRTFRRAARLLLATARPGDPESPANWPAFAALAPHVIALLGPSEGLSEGLSEPPKADAPADEQAFRSLLLNICRYQYLSGQYPAGRRLAEDTHRWWTVSLGANHPDTLSAARHLAIVLHDLNEVAAARSLYEDTLARCRRALGEDHRETLSVAHGLGRYLRDRGDYHAARGIDEDTLARCRRILGEDHPETLNAASNLALDLRRIGDHQAAHVLDAGTLARRRRVLGDEHPYTMGSADSLALDLFALGRHDEAISLHKDTLARMRRVLGHDHPLTLRSANNLGRELSTLGRLEEARALHADTLARMRRVLGHDHPTTLACAYNVALGLETLGDLSGAQELAHDTLARQRRVLGEEHPETKRTATILAQRSATQ